MRQRLITICVMGEKTNMAVYRDKSNGYDGKTWRVAVYYTDWQGNKKKHEKRGFKTKKSAQSYETEFIAKKKKDINMGFSAFVELYLTDIKPQIKLTTYVTKENIINTHILPYFENKSLSDIHLLTFCSGRMNC